MNYRIIPVSYTHLEVPLFGRAARESRIESLHAEREVLSERFATLSFDVQKTQRLHQAFSLSLIHIFSLLQLLLRYLLANPG